MPHNLETVPLTKSLMWRVSPRSDNWWIADWSTPAIRSWAGASDSGANALRVLASDGLVTGLIAYPGGFAALAIDRTWWCIPTLYRRPIVDKGLDPIAMDRAETRIDDELRENAGHFRFDFDPSDFLWKIRLRFFHQSEGPEHPDLENFRVEALFLPRYEQLHADPGYQIGGRRV